MTDPAKEFVSARLKIKRAYRHIEELQKILSEFLKSDFCSMRVDQDAKTGQALIYVESNSAPPPEMSLIIGDAVHNLRTALDHVIVQILGERGNRASFPIAKERDNLGAHPTYAKIKEVLPDLAALILEKIRIHDTGEPSIWALGAIDNIDKHNLLVGVVSIQELNGFGVKNERQNIVVENNRVTIGENGRLNFAKMPGPIKITNKGKATAQILFDKGQPLEGKLIIQSLNGMAQLTSQAVDTLEAFWFGQRHGGAAIK